MYVGMYVCMIYVCMYVCGEQELECVCLYTYTYKSIYLYESSLVIYKQIYANADIKSRGNCDYVIKNVDVVV